MGWGKVEAPLNDTDAQYSNKERRTKDVMDERQTQRKKTSAKDIN